MPLNEKQPHINLVKTAPPITENIPILTKEGNFEVKESIALNLLIAVVICTVCSYEINQSITAFAEGKRNYAAFIYSAIFLLGIIGIILKIFNRKPIILVNQQGIYVHNKLVTNWRNFADAKYKEIARRYHFVFILLVYYFKDDGEFYVFKTPLTSTQNKAEEEVIKAIRYFYQLSQAKEGSAG